MRLLVSVALATPMVALASPQVLAHSGRAVGADGAPLDQVASVRFDLVDGANVVAWTETRSVRFENGAYATPLGTITPIDPTLLTRDLTLVVTTGATELARAPLAASAYALAVDGAVRVSAAPSACAAPAHGSLRWTGDRIELCGPTGWQPILPAASASRFRGFATTQSNAATAPSGTIPWDDTVPQITEGNEILSLDYAAKALGDRLVFEGVVHWAEPSNHSDYFTIALFRVGISSAIAVSTDGASNGNGRCTANGTYMQICSSPFQFTWSADSTTTETYKLRVGLNGGSVALNQGENGRRLGGTLYHSLSVTEYAP